MSASRLLAGSAAEGLLRSPGGSRSNRRADRVDLEFSLVLKSSRFGLDPRAARVTWTILVFLAALALFFAYLLFPLVRLV